MSYISYRSGMYLLWLADVDHEAEIDCLSHSYVERHCASQQSRRTHTFGEASIHGRTHIDQIRRFHLDNNASIRLRTYRGYARPSLSCRQDATNGCEKNSGVLPRWVLNTLCITSQAFVGVQLLEICVGYYAILFAVEKKGIRCPGARVIARTIDEDRLFDHSPSHR